MDASVLVVKGTFVMGLGEEFDRSQGHELPAGSFMRCQRVCGTSSGPSVKPSIYVYGAGPLDHDLRQSG